MWVTKAREAGHRGKPSALSHQHSSKGRGRGSQLTPEIIFGLMQSFFLPEFAHYVGDRAMLAVHGVVQGAHVLIGNLSRQWPARRAAGDGGPAPPRARWLRRSRAGSSAGRPRAQPD